MRAQIENPKLDQLAFRMFHILEGFKLSGTILDVGCYTGALYHYLGKPKGYVGIDIWPEAIEVAKEFAPEADFRVANGFEFKGHFDTLWCSQIVWAKCGVDVSTAIEKLSKLADRCIFVLTPGEGASIKELPIVHGMAVYEINGPRLP